MGSGVAEGAASAGGAAWLVKVSSGVGVKIGSDVAGAALVGV